MLQQEVKGDFSSYVGIKAVVYAELLAAMKGIEIG